MSENKLYWFAVYTKPRWEKKVARLLDEKDIEHYCPLKKVVKQWSDRKKTISEPVFTSYVFVRITEEKKWDLKNIAGIVNFVYWLGKPAHIRDEEISTIRKFLNEFPDVEIESGVALQLHSKVRVRQGVLMNYHGILLEITGNRARVQIESMGLQLSANFDRRNLEAISSIN